MRKNKSYIVPVFIIAVFVLWFWSVQNVIAQTLNVKLPYQNKQSFIVTQGYKSPPTHIHKDGYALDFTQNGCDEYGKNIVAAISGKVWLREETGYNGGYGAEILVLSDGNIVSRYAHFIQGSIPVKVGDEVQKGDVLGRLGNSGLVIGTACALHPGAHLHFAMYDKNADGSFSARNPEPISGYINIKEGKWYVSDNDVANSGVLGGLSAIMGDVANKFFGTDENVPAVNDNGMNGSSLLSGDDMKSSFKIVSSTAFSVSTSKQVVSSQENESTNFLITDISQASTSSSSPLVVEKPSTSQPQVFVQNIQNISTQSGGVSFTLVNAQPPPETSHENTASSQSFSNNDLSTSSSTQSNASSTDSDENNSSTTNQNTSTSSIVISTSSDATSTMPLPAFSFGKVTPAASNTSIGIFNPKTFAIDLSWTPPLDASGSSEGITYSIFVLNSALGDLEPNLFSAASVWSGTSTVYSYQIPIGGRDYHFDIRATDIAGDMSDATTTVSISDSLVSVQAVDDGLSHWSWYDDNWYRLGKGFDMTLHGIFLEASGYDANNYRETPSYINISEFSDSNYGNLITSTPIFAGLLSNITNASTSKTFIGGLNIVLKPNRYYRLDTLYYSQNGSVILKGTTATGTAMWDQFIYGEGKVDNSYSFYPYLSLEGIQNFSPQMSINPPLFISISFDLLSGRLYFSWPAAIYSDSSPGSFTYSINCGTAPVLDDTRWQSVGSSLSASCNIDPFKNYYIGVRAMDDAGNVSAPIIKLWNSPIGVPVAS